MNFFVKVGLGIKERFRKFIVGLKRKPQIIPMLVIIVAFLIYALNMSVISNTTSYILGKNMGFCEFCTFLLSALSFVCVLNAYPKREKVKVPMLILAFVLLAVVIFCDLVYYLQIHKALYPPVYSTMNESFEFVGSIVDNVGIRMIEPVKIDEAHIYVSQAQSMLVVHIVFVGLAFILLALVPLYGKLIKKINTSIDVQGTEINGSIEYDED